MLRIETGFLLFCRTSFHNSGCREKDASAVPSCHRPHLLTTLHRNRGNATLGAAQEWARGGMRSCRRWDGPTPGSSHRATGSWDSAAAAMTTILVSFRFPD